MDDFEKAFYKWIDKMNRIVSPLEAARWAREWLLNNSDGPFNSFFKLRTENQRLQKIIAKELSENDELGCEYTYVNVLKDENQRLREALEKMLDDKADLSGLEMLELAEQALAETEGE